MALYDHNYIKSKRKATKKEPKRGKDFYLTRGLTTKQIQLLDEFYTLPMESKEVLRGIIPKFAEERGVHSKNIILREKQIDPVLMSYINPRFFIGDKPGLGKTVMSAAAYAYYGFMQLKKEKEVGKVMVVTEAAHVVKFAKEWQSYGINMLALHGGTQRVDRQLESYDREIHDGIVVGWDGMRTNGFTEFYLKNYKDYKMGVFDETSKILNPKSMVTRVSDAVINKYKGGLERVLFLNGSSFEKEVYDFYYQFNILQPRLIPSKKFLDERYVIKEMNAVYRKTSGGRAKKQRFAEIVDYKNQGELKERLKYYYLARSKEDYVADAPEHEYNLHVVYLTEEQKSMLSIEKNMTLVNSPTTTDESKKLTRKTHHKLDALLKFYKEVEEDRPLVYVYNKESQKTMVKELKKMGYKVGLLNGDVSAEGKSKMIDKFNNYALDTLVFNVEKAINIPTSDRIIFYDVPTMPQTTSQIMARIDRNNYTTSKKYDFFSYYGSPEWINLTRLGYFREHHSSEFTGQEGTVYATIIEQMEKHMEKSVRDEIKSLFKETEDKNKEFKDISPRLEELLMIGN